MCSRTGILVLAASFALAGRAAAAPLPPPAAPAAAVAPGALVTTPVPAWPTEVREFELVLVPERGPAIRVCPETPAGARAVRWRMPAVAARSARLVWRTGGEGSESESAASAAFDLAPLPAGEAQRLAQGRSEAGAPLAGSLAGGPAALAGAGGPPSIAPAGATASAVETSAPPLSLPRESASAPAPAPRALPAPAAARPAEDLEPVFTPLRN